MTFTLTDEQDAIIQAPIDHYVISAVAGSGKTTTLAHRIQFLLNQGIDPKRLLILMFNKAAREDFQAKLSLVLSAGHQHAKLPEVRTFHAMGYRLYLRFIEEGYLPAFKPNILSDKEQDFQIWLLLNRILPNERLSELKREKKDYIETSRRFIETVKSGLTPADIVFDSLDLDPKFRFLLDLFDHFEAWRKQERRISYSDMLYEPVLAIRAHPELKALVENKMDIILVDEYQDTNDIQHALLSYIAGSRAKITVVGDPDQTIYEFRGAKPEYIIQGFSDEFAGANQLSLSVSFRYGHAVSLLANHLIRHNKSRLPVLCKSHESTPQTKITLHQDQDEIQSLCQLLSSTPVEHYPDHCILLRVWSQSISLELALLKAGIPYHLDGHTGVFHSTEMKALEAILELAAGVLGQDEPSIRAEKLSLIFQFPHIGLPEHASRQLCEQLADVNHHYGEQLLRCIPEEIKPFQVKKIERLAKVLHTIETQALNSSAILKTYAEATELYEGIRSLSFNHDQAEERVRSITSMMDFLTRYDAPPLMALNNLQELGQRAIETHSQSIKMTTIHRAKGLEWQRVFIPGLTAKTLPYTLRNDQLSLAELESERRLLYVAMTRAKHSLDIFSPAPKQTNETASPFLKELQFSLTDAFSRHLYENKETPFRLECTQQHNKVIKQYAEAMTVELELDTQTIQPLTRSPDASAQKPIQWLNQYVEHCLLGKGKVVEDRASSFTVEFDAHEKRTFSKQFADRFFTFS